MRAWAAVGFAVLVSQGGSGCADSDIGRCCELLEEGIMPDPRPSSTDADGDPLNDVARDPAFDCASLTCVAFRGSDAYCTEACEVDTDCPEGFVCRAILQSDPGDDAPIQPEDRFCVRPNPEISCDS